MWETQWSDHFRGTGGRAVRVLWPLSLPFFAVVAVLGAFASVFVTAVYCFYCFCCCFCWCSCCFCFAVSFVDFPAVAAAVAPDVLPFCRFLATAFAAILALAFVAFQLLFPDALLPLLLRSCLCCFLPFLLRLLLVLLLLLLILILISSKTSCESSSKAATAAAKVTTM